MAWIYQTATSSEAHIRIAKVDDPEMADLCVYLVSSMGMANGDGFWFVHRSKQSARTWVHFTSIGIAEVKVCFVDQREQAGWRRKHPLQGRFK